MQRGYESFVHQRHIQLSPETEAEPRHAPLVVYPWERELHLSQITRVTILRVRDFVGILTNLVASKISLALYLPVLAFSRRIVSHTGLYTTSIRISKVTETDDDWS